MLQFKKTDEIFTFFATNEKIKLKYLTVQIEAKFYSDRLGFIPVVNIYGFSTVQTLHSYQAILDHDLNTTPNSQANVLVITLENLS